MTWTFYNAAGQEKQAVANMVGPAGPTGPQGPLGPGAVTAKGASFPSSPSDGETFDLQESTMYAAGVTWRFVWRSLRSWWEFVGGAPMIAESNSSVSTSSTSYVNQTDMTMDLPYPGRYDIRVEAFLQTAAIATNAALISVGYGSVIGSDLTAAVLSTPTTTSAGGVVSSNHRTDVALANLNIKQSLRSSSGGAGTVTALRQRKLIVTPVRIPIP
jgi:hypothetical protein